MTPAEMIAALLDAVTAKDLPAVMALIADDAVFFDPHYPETRMVGKQAIARGIGWGLSTLEQPGFKVRTIWTEGTTGVAEVDTDHVIRGRMRATFDQVFVFETRDDQFTRLQAYLPYRAHGIGGLIPRVSRVVWRLRGRRLSRPTLTASRP